MGCVCAANANLDIAQLEAHNKDHKAETAKTNSVGVTPEIPSIPKSALKTNLSEIDLGPIDDGNITPFPNNEKPSINPSSCNVNNNMLDIIDNDIDGNVSSYSDDKSNKCIHVLTNSGTLSENNDDDYKVEITLNNNNEIMLNILNEYINKKWLKILINEEANDIQSINNYFNKLQNIINNGVIKCIVLDNGECQINMFINNDTFEFIVPEYNM